MISCMHAWYIQKNKNIYNLSKVKQRLDYKGLYGAVIDSCPGFGSNTSILIFPFPIIPDDINLKPKHCARKWLGIVQVCSFFLVLLQSRNTDVCFQLPVCRSGLWQTCAVYTKTGHNPVNDFDLFTFIVREQAHFPPHLRRFVWP